jgi:hypothetical protein
MGGYMETAEDNAFLTPNLFEHNLKIAVNPPVLENKGMNVQRKESTMNTNIIRES